MWITLHPHSPSLPVSTTVPCNRREAGCQIGGAGKKESEVAHAVDELPRVAAFGGSSDLPPRCNLLEPLRRSPFGRGECGRFGGPHPTPIAGAVLAETAVVRRHVPGNFGATA